jgi:hypothetical protein
MTRISCKPQSGHPPPDGTGTCLIYKQALKYRINIHKIGHLKIKNYKFKRVENFKYLGVVLDEDNNNKQTCKKE